MFGLFAWNQSAATGEAPIPPAPPVVSRQIGGYRPLARRPGHRAAMKNRPKAAFPWTVAALSLRAHVREQDHVADRRRVGQQHHQAVDADAFAGGRRHAVFQGIDEVGVVVHRLVVAGVLLLDLQHEALGLVLGVVQLGIGIGDLAAADEQLEAVSDARVFVVAAGQRRNLEGVAGDEVRLLQLVLHQFLENHHLQLAQAFVAEDLGAGLLGDGPRLLDVVEVGGADLRVVLEDRIEHRQAHERLAEMEDLVAVGHVGGTEHRLGQLAEQFLGQVHVVFVVGVGLVELEHGEFGVVPGRDAFVTEVAVDLEDLLETADHQALEVQLRGDAQEHGHVQRVVMGLERFTAAPPGMVCSIGVSTSRKPRSLRKRRMWAMTWERTRKVWRVSSLTIRST